MGHFIEEVRGTYHTSEHEEPSVYHVAGWFCTKAGEMQVKHMQAGPGENRELCKGCEPHKDLLPHRAEVPELAKEVLATVEKLRNRREGTA